MLDNLLLLLWVKLLLICAFGFMGDLQTLMPPRQRRSINSKYLCNLAVREIISSFTQYQIFDRFLNQIHGG
jgi:hypothetical protein